MEKRLEMTVTLTVDDYTRGIFVGDLLGEIIENLSCLTEGVYAVHTNYTLNGKTRDEALVYACECLGQLPHCPMCNSPFTIEGR